MLTVWKFPVRWDDSFSAEMPKSAKVLTVQMQNSDPQMWALLDPTEPRRTRTFRLAGTGHLIKQAANELEYVDTFQTEGLVFHLFEVLE